MKLFLILTLMLSFPLSAFSQRKDIAGTADAVMSMREAQIKQEAKNPWTVGLPVVHVETLYKDYDDTTTPFPYVLYNGDLFYFGGVRLGVKVYKSQNAVISPFVEYAGDTFDAKESDNAQMKLLNDRNGTAMAGLSGIFFYNFGTIATFFSGDILNEHSGLRGSLNYTLPQQKINDNLSFIFNIGTVWQDEKYNDYYYGVSKNESIKSGIQEYQVGSDFNNFIAIIGIYKFTKQLTLSCSATFTQIGDEIKNSPIVDNSIQNMYSVGLYYKF